MEVPTNESPESSGEPVALPELEPSTKQQQPSLAQPEAATVTQSALDRIEHTLYDPKQKPDNFAVRQAKDHIDKPLPTSWGDVTPVITATSIKEKMSFGMKLLIISALILCGALSYTAWRVLSSSNVVSSANIDVVLDIAPYVEGGEVVPLMVKVTNRNGVALDSVALTLMYKKGDGSQDEEEKVSERKEEGTLPPGMPLLQSFNVSLFGGEAESRDITVKLEYKVVGSNATFSKNVTVPVVLKTPPMSVSIDGPSILSIGQSGTFAVSIKNNTSTTTVPSVLLLTLPTNFVIESTSPKPLSRSTAWGVPALSPGEAYTTTIIGSVSGSQGEVSTMKASIGSQGNAVTDIGVVYASQTFDIALRTSPLAITILLETERGGSDTLRYGDVATAVITYKNTSDRPLKDLNLVMTIKGDAVSEMDIVPDSGYYDSVRNTITWDSSTLPDIGTLQVGGERTLRVRMPIVLKGINSPKLTLDIGGVASLVETNDVVTSVTKSWAVQGSASLSAETRYKKSPFTNIGPIPPTPNTDTTYTAHLTLSTQNALDGIKVSFTIPIYVTWRNMTSDSEKITYDQRSRLVTWSLGKVPAGQTLSADIGFSVRPSQSQVRQSPPITSSIILDATEEVSRANLRTTISPLTTFISNENWPVDPSRVVDR